MPIDRDALTPQQRLAISRRALVNQLNGGRSPLPEADGDPLRDPVEEGEGARPSAASTLLDKFAWTSVGRKVVERWWRRHPANAASQLARPLLERYARQQPGKLVAGAAAVGALLVLVRPWRLLSATAVIAAVMKSSDVADMVTTLMHRAPRDDSDSH